MMKPKAALVKDGFLPAGSENKRGRLSGDAVNRLKELAANGWNIEGFTVSKPTAEVKDNDEPVKVERVKRDSSAIEELVPMTRDENALEAFTSNGKIGFRTVCNICGSSLTHCPCPQPKVWLDYNREGVVYFKPTAVSKKG